MVTEAEPDSSATPRTLDIVDEQNVALLLPMPELIEAVGDALVRFPDVPPRAIVEGRNSDWLLMPAIGEAPSRFVCKIVRVSKDASSRRGPTVAGRVLVFSDDAILDAVIDAGSLTARRTAAVAGYATDRLANTRAAVLALFGVGALAEPHIEALNAVRPLREIRVVATSVERSGAFVARLRERGWPIRTADAASALRGADLVATLTTSEHPVFSDSDLEPGAHINAMGSYKPDRHEIPVETVARARVVVEKRQSAWQEAGDLIQARAAGLITNEHVVAELGDAQKWSRVRRSASDVTLFKSVGHAAFDLVAVDLLLRNLRGAPDFRLTTQFA